MSQTCASAADRRPEADVANRALSQERTFGSRNAPYAHFANGTGTSGGRVRFECPASGSGIGSKVSRAARCAGAPPTKVPPSVEVDRRVLILSVEQPKTTAVGIRDLRSSGARLSDAQGASESVSGCNRDIALSAGHAAFKYEAALG